MTPNKQFFRSALRWKRLPVVAAAVLLCGIVFGVAWRERRRAHALPDCPRFSVGLVEFEDGDVRGTSRLKQILASEPCFDWEPVPPAAIRIGSLKKYDVVVFPAGRPDLPECVPLAMYRTETWSFEFQRGTMVDTPAILAGSFGDGHVLVISAHPETTAGLEFLVKRAIVSTASGFGRKKEPRRDDKPPRGSADAS